MAEGQQAGTHTVDNPLSNLELAKRDVASAEGQLESLLSELRVAPRAEKTGVSLGIQAALDRLRAARTKLEDVERVLSRKAGAA